MNTRKVLGLGLIAILVGACGAESTPEVARSSQALPAAPASVTAPRHIVSFSGRSIDAAVTALGGEVEFSHAGAGIAVVSGLDAAGAQTLASSGGVDAVEADAVVQIDTTSSGSALAAAALPQSPSTPAGAYFFPQQWNLRAISADKAWARGRLGSSAVTVAILDTGIDYGHPDLAGLVDLSRSASFVPVDDYYASIFFPTHHPVTDLHYHGTHVAATVASNGYVAAGVTSKTTLIGVKVCGVTGGCELSAIISGVLFATDQGADVLNMSLGGAFPKAHNGRYVGLINSVFNYARSKGATVVVAAGNEATDLQHNTNTYATYCDTPSTICVSATAPTAGGIYGPWSGVDTLTPYSNYGNTITVAAPGGYLEGWVWAACSQTSLIYTECGSGAYVLGLAGTSMASPHVAGLAALAVEDHGRNPGQVRAAIRKGADDVGKRGSDPYFGAGRINVDATAQ